ncbi:dockerin type I domain-containing protein [Ruminococcus sp.]|uniref:dockerin type I domain-containing protein n=1 Tax=Ruminococcus sp. TaxID=41978 RepID=UPI0025CBB822|nr:dockerin type I domain-containing protein [Ruminococcus sp.]
MKFRKFATGIMASALMACSASAVSANAATTAATATLNAQVASSAKLVSGIDSLIKLRRTMPMKGDINGDKKVNEEDAAVLDVYLKGLIKITKDSTAYRVLDVNWDDKLDSTDFDIMLKKSPTTSIPLISIIRAYTLRTGDFNYDGVVDSKDLSNLNNNLDSKRIPSPSYMKINGRIVNTTSYISPLLRNDLHDLNHDGFVNSKDVDLMESYISYPIIYRLY